MDDLRFALLIVGIVVVAVIYALARKSRRRAASRREDSELAALDSHDGVEFGQSGIARNRPDTEAETIGEDTIVRDLGGVFTPTRETPDAEPSVDVTILAGLRATYESTMDDALEDSVVREPPDAELTSDSDQNVPDTDRSTPEADRGTADAGHDTADAGWGIAPEEQDTLEPLAIDMTRPLVYLTLVAKEGRVSGRVVRDSLHEEGFAPGLMRLYYWRSDDDSRVTFGVANMVEPGILDPDELPDMETPGLVAFMSVPDDSASAFRVLDAIVAVSRRLARRIDATLCDETRSTLTAQAENHLRETVAEILRRGRT